MRLYEVSRRVMNIPLTHLACVTSHLVNKLFTQYAAKNAVVVSCPVHLVIFEFVTPAELKSRVINFSGLSGNVQTKSLDQHFECLQNVYVFAYVINKIESDIPCWAQCPSNQYIVHIKPNW